MSNGEDRTRAQLAGLRALCEQDRAALQAMGRDLTQDETSWLKLLERALVAIDEASTASTFVENLGDALRAASGRLDGPP
jgi:hypothetical protein